MSLNDYIAQHGEVMDRALARLQGDAEAQAAIFLLLSRGVGPVVYALMMGATTTQCNKCAGRGGNEACKCKGLGRILPDKVECARCEGQGHIMGDGPCEPCHARGYFTPPSPSQ